ncbi:sulfotransferase domain-containing protein [Tateyamaria omphalii]|uniref:sulfotransferase domain-containing protein n=1 Tax=Tateyamaria omphalii TaxID=299262 RepID=UPI001C99128A|nr:sulfotransferase domain-containing protein [Tateyamaria omphalii]MBY5933336.1 sulfotransferase domain-containing protein [Tateyamaria omphalii]
MANFDYFVVFAEMRTGSNFLETNLNAFEGISCHGEAFNPFFIGYPNNDNILGVTLATREENPKALLREIKKTPDLSGFRYFHDHDPRIFDKIVDDPKCAKIVLTRNPVDSYVSRKIAQATGQWKLTDAKARKDSKATFDADEFATHLGALQDFQVTLLNRLQSSGQTAFYVAYEDLQNLSVMNGLAKWLGVDSALEALDKSLKVQNPSAVADKVSNAAQMTEALSGLDRFNLTRTPNFEPRRGAAVPTYFASQSAPLMYLPIRGWPEDQALRWMQAIDKLQGGKPASKLSQNEMRDWMRSHPGHRSFTVLRHPLARAHAVFCHRILNTGKGGYGGIRTVLGKRYQMAMPDDPGDASYDKVAHRTAFAAFLKFLKANLNGQTAVRVDPDWASQAKTVEGFAEFVLPDRLIRIETMAHELAELSAAVGLASVPELGAAAPDAPYQLIDVYDPEIEDLCRAVYARDYLMFGFKDWTPV